MFIGNVLKTQRVVVGFDTYRGESKMKIAITILLLIFTIKLSATPIDEFNQIIKETNINQSKYENITFDNIENNQTQQEAKALFEQILPYYLKTKILFSKERLERLNHEQIVIDANDKNPTPLVTMEDFEERDKNRYKNMTTRDIHYYGIFFEMLYGYIKEMEHDDVLTQKALEETLQLVENSMDKMDYMIGLSMLKKLYKIVDKKELLENSPPPSRELLYQKIEQDKCNMIDGWGVPRYKEGLSKEQNRKANEAMHSFGSELEKKFDPFIKRYIEALKGGSKEELEQLKRYRKEEKKRVYSGKVKSKSERYFILLMQNRPNIGATLYTQQLQNEVEEIYNEKLQELGSKKSSWSLYFWYAFLGLLFFYLLWLFLDFLRWIYYKIR